MDEATITKVREAAWNKGFAFGKYTQDIPLTQDVIDLMENSNELIRLFIEQFKRGAQAGQLETLRN
ncbi:hypothetical protein [Acinetobacter ursingii]|uniref:hypothetical protein n=1 Tax=Acinetobacter ursingii TaxID=108980 RepID=UPI00124CD1BE|nr:hypothetical protein [Acinetobacter ursingii]